MKIFHKPKKYLIITLISLFINLSVTAQNTIDEKVDSILNLMSLAEKVGQMAQAERGELENINDIATYGLGSLLSGGGSAPTPNTLSAWSAMYDNFQGIALQSNRKIPVIYGIDAVHGHNNVYGAVIFPHNIGMGCTWNADLVRNAYAVVAREVAATGIDWTFAPCIAVPRNERWGRTYEGFGETPEIQKIMAAASVSGLQGSDLSDAETILACVKHYVGDGGTQDGIDQGNTIAFESSLREIHMAGYIDAIEAGTGSVMASFNSWNGEKLHGHDYLLTDVLKTELGFEGFIVSDWKGVDQIHEDYREAIKRAINAGIDMVMVPDRYEVFIGHLISLVQDGEVSEERINDAVRRILKQKFLLDLFEEPYTNNALAAAFGSQEHRDIARQAVRESIVLLNAKNDVLPLQKNGQTILVAGTLAKDLGAQCGGWTISWQGSNGNITTGTDILTGIQEMAGSSEIIYSATGDYNGSADAAVVVIGEKTPYAEGAGDRSDLSLDAEDLMLVKKIKEKGIPTIVLLVSGRPMIISNILPSTDAFLAVWYPGTEGDGIAEVLFGDHEPSGKLTHSWPKDMDQVPINFGDYYYNPLFEYKHGLQQFPDAASSSELLPYAAAVNGDGNQIILALTDMVTSLVYQPGDLTVKVDNIIMPDMITGISLDENDGSILLIDLNSQIQAEQEISITYTGESISSSGLILEYFSDLYVWNGAGNAAGGVNEVPGKVEAEDYFDMYGIQTEPCTDIGGGLNVGYIEAGDWMKYQVKVAESGLYSLSCRISGYEPGTLQFAFNDSIQAFVGYTATNGWQNWQDFTTEVYLNAGNYNMEVVAQYHAFNINYYHFELKQGISDQEPAISDIRVFPNPASSGFHVDFLNSGGSRARIRLIDVTGKISRELYNGSIDPGKNLFNFSLDRELPSGLYFVEITDESKRYFIKLLKD